MKFVLKIDSARYGKGVFITDELRIALEAAEDFLSTLAADDAISTLNILLGP